MLDRHFQQTGNGYRNLASSKYFDRSFTVIVDGTTSQNRRRIRQAPSTATERTSGQSSTSNFSRSTNCFSSKLSFSSFDASGSSKGNMSNSRSNALRRTFEFATCMMSQLLQTGILTICFHFKRNWSFSCAPV